MISVFSEKIKTGRQIKTKDQNLKKKYFLNTSSPCDLLELSYKKVIEFVNKGKTIEALSAKNTLAVQERIRRFEVLIEQCSKYEK